MKLINFILGFLVVGFVFFFSMETLLGLLICLILVVFVSSLILYFLSAGSWLSLALLIALVSGLIVVLTYVILMYPTPLFSFFYKPGWVFLCFLMSLAWMVPIWINFQKEMTQVYSDLNFGNEFSTNILFFPFSSCFIFAVLVLFSTLFIVELIIKQRSFNVKI